MSKKDVATKDSAKEQDPDTTPQTPGAKLARPVLDAEIEVAERIFDIAMSEQSEFRQAVASYARDYGLEVAEVDDVGEQYTPWHGRVLCRLESKRMMNSRKGDAFVGAHIVILAQDRLSIPDDKFKEVGRGEVLMLPLGARFRLMKEAEIGTVWVIDPPIVDGKPVKQELDGGRSFWPFNLAKLAPKKKPSPQLTA